MICLPATEPAKKEKFEDATTKIRAAMEASISQFKKVLDKNFVLKEDLVKLNVDLVKEAKKKLVAAKLFNDAILSENDISSESKFLEDERGFFTIGSTKTLFKKHFNWTLIYNIGPPSYREIPKSTSRSSVKVYYLCEFPISITSVSESFASNETMELTFKRPFFMCQHYEEKIKPNITSILRQSLVAMNNMSTISEREKNLNDAYRKIFSAIESVGLFNVIVGNKFSPVKTSNLSSNLPFLRATSKEPFEWSLTYNFTSPLN